MNKFKGFPSADRQTEEFFKDKNRRVSCKSQSSGSNSEDDLKKGVVFRSACSGLFYRNHKAAGDVKTVYIDGVPFDRCDSHPI